MEDWKNPEYEALYDAATTERDAYERLSKIVRVLRKECPWDKVQTHDSLRICMIEEAYEALEAIQNDDVANLREELGDVTLQVLLNGIIAEETDGFDLTDVYNEECEKMIRRHPHIFGEESTKTIDKVLKKWENIKSKEHGDTLLTDRLTGVPKALPALIRSEKVQKRTEQIGIPIEDVNDIGKTFRSEEELGDMLFAIVNAARKQGMNPELALARSTDAFVFKLQEGELNAKKSGVDFTTMKLEDLF